jgi:uncharacterized protein
MMLPIRKTHRQHAGELHVQRMRNAPADQSSYISGAINDEMSSQHVDYYRQLQFLPIGALDASGKPWVTILCNPTVTAPTNALLQVTARVNAADPFVVAARSSTSRPIQFAGVGIDFRRRSRVKIAGVVESAALSAHSDGDTQLNIALQTKEHMGNCPKYITIRQLRPLRRAPITTSFQKHLPTQAVDLLEKASTIFIATRHHDQDERESDMGCNHRGGPKGFVRYLEDENGAYLVLPDYSGNRFYQSLGNVETDPVMGIAIPDFTTGDLLQVSGSARNLFNADAEMIMPGATLVTLVSIDEAFLTRGALDLELVGHEQMSPYNPKLRLLAKEAPPAQKPVDVTATLIGIKKESKLISTFTFALPNPAELVPGGHAIFDFSKYAERQYRHMNDRDPQSLNDDYVRTYTVSAVSEDKRQIAITVKKSGKVSSFLHAQTLDGDEPLELHLKGLGGNFTCFDESNPVPKMIWVAGGAGITPFLAMYRALRASRQPLPEIELYYSCRGDELDLIAEMTDVDVKVFDSTSSSPLPGASRRTFFDRRITSTDLPEAYQLVDKTIFICGPAGLMANVNSWLDGKIDPSRIRFESFTF